MDDVPQSPREKALKDKAKAREYMTETLGGLREWLEDVFITIAIILVFSLLIAMAGAPGILIKLGIIGACWSLPIKILVSLSGIALDGGVIAVIINWHRISEFFSFVWLYVRPIPAEEEMPKHGPYRS